MALFRPVSNSTTPLGQSRAMRCSRVTTSPGRLDQLLEDLERLVLQPVGVAVPGDFSRIEVHLPAIEPDFALVHAPSGHLGV